MNLRWASSSGPKGSEDDSTKVKYNNIYEKKVGRTILSTFFCKINFILNSNYEQSNMQIVHIRNSALTKRRVLMIFQNISKLTAL